MVSDIEVIGLIEMIKGMDAPKKHKHNWKSVFPDDNIFRKCSICGLCRKHDQWGYKYWKYD